MKRVCRILMLIIGLNFLLLPLAEAKIVQVYNGGAYTLVQSMNRFADIGKMSINIGNLYHVGKMMPDSPYDIYAATAGTDKSGAIFFMYCNDAGYVSKATVTVALSRQDSYKYGWMTVSLALRAFGVSDSEASILLSNRLKENYHSDVWCDKAERRILVEVVLDEEHGLATTRIWAVDQ